MPDPKKSRQVSPHFMREFSMLGTTLPFTDSRMTKKKAYILYGQKLGQLNTLMNNIMQALMKR
jgi:hypothetical protein